MQITLWFVEIVKNSIPNKYWEHNRMFFGVLKMQLTSEILKKIFVHTSDDTIGKFVDPLNKTCAKYNINTVSRLTMFLAQIGHESMELNAVKENLNYSANALRATFPSRFPTDAIANLYARQPEKIANKIYASRMGNGDEASGDGFKYRGRGLIQLTGKNNYSFFAKSMNMTLDQAVAYLETPEGAAMSAGWFWNNDNINPLADKNDFIAVTKTINGGTLGLADRQRLLALAQAVITA